MDIFRGWDNYVSRLQENWMAAVKEEDAVVLGGDLSWAMKLSDSRADFAFINQLPGRKLIIKGNHDLWWESVTKMRRFFSENEFETLDFIHNNAAAVEGIALCGTRGWFFDDESQDKKVLLREAGRLEASVCEGEKTGLPITVFLHYPPVTRERECPEMMEVLRAHQIKTVYYGHIHGSGAGRAVNGDWDGIQFKLTSADYLGFMPKRVF